MEIKIEIRETDALKLKTDVLVLKYAQEFYGADSLAFSRLGVLHKNIEAELPGVNKFLFLESKGGLGATYVLFTGVVELFQFRYKEIRNFSFNSLKYLAETGAKAEHICFTLHGANYGLDEKEAFEAEIAGIVDAIARGMYPPDLEKITIVENYKPRAQRLMATLEELLPDGIIVVRGKDRTAKRSVQTSRLISEAGINSEAKPLIFVAMPFDKKMDDVFHYGIRNAVNSAGFLCERADQVIFTGDILGEIKRRISRANLVIADLTSSNPNVYLEIGFAWGLGIPTVLLVQDPQELRFDVKSQRCIVYSAIKELEENLRKELAGLR